MIRNIMNIDYPLWLDKEFVQKVLRIAEKDDSIELKSINLSAATKEGDNFGSLMIRVKTDFKRKNHVTASQSLIVKVKKTDDPGFLDADEMFETEASMMIDILFRMNQLLPDESTLSAKAFYWQDKNPVILVLEDLTARGFRMINRGIVLDHDHLFITIRNVARFHASSFALGERDPTAIRKYAKGFYHSNQRRIFWKFVKRNIRSISKAIAELPAFASKYAEKIARLETCVEKKAVEAAACKESEFNVLCHGDLWSNNMLYRYDDHGKPIEHMFVDFQMCYYASPAYDLLFAFATIVRDDTIRDKLLLEYHATLEWTMSILDCQYATPSIEDLKKAMREHAFIEVVVTLLTLPIVLQIEQIEGLDPMEATGDDFEMSVTRTEVYLNILKQRLPRWDEAGLFDIE